MPLLAIRQWHCESSLEAVSQRLELLSITFIISKIEWLQSSRSATVLQTKLPAVNFRSDFLQFRGRG